MSGEPSTIRATTTTGKSPGCYLYAITETGLIPDLGPIGLVESPVYCISNGQFNAIVSDIPNERLRPVRRNLAAHHEVLKKLNGLGMTVLPMAFGLMADTPKSITKMLTTYRTQVNKQFERLQGKVEMGLHVMWDVPNIFEFFVNNNVDLQQLRDQMFRNGREPSQDAKIEIGRLFEKLLAEARTHIQETVLETLGTHYHEVKVNPPRNDKEIVNLAFLISRDSQKRFEEGVFETASKFDQHYAFDFNGPWPPHNFVDLVINL